MAWGFKERRKFPRAAFTCRIAVKFTQRELTAQTKNISAGGVRIAIEEKLNPSDTIQLELFLKKDNPVTCEGRVVWATEVMNPMQDSSRMYDVGIEFMNISDEDREYIKQMVEMLLADKGDV